jgi:hypothetical protein
MKYISHILKPNLLNQLAFYCLLGSGAYIILLWSPNVMGDFFHRYTKLIIYLIPWLMVCLAYSWQVITNREHRLEILSIVLIIILGIVNTALSDSLSHSLNSMRNFLLMGIFALWAAMFLLNDPRRRRAFDWFCTGALAVVILAEMTVYVVRGKSSPGVFEVFALHLIPLGTLIILLSPGPVRLIAAQNPAAKLLGWLLALSGGFLILLTHKRGTWLALAAMLAAGMIFLVRRHKYLLLSICLVLALILPLQAKHRFSRLDPTLGHHITILHRLELYPFALHVWKTHPLMGIGLRPYTHEKYLPDYHLHNQDLREFPQAVATLQTFDNMLLTAFVEMGSLMTLLYLGLIAIIVIRYGRILWSSSESSPLGWYRLLVLFGFAIHSLTYDSLLFPSVNWLFHVQLGIMAGYPASDGGRLSHPGATILSET